MRNVYEECEMDYDDRYTRKIYCKECAVRIDDLDEEYIELELCEECADEEVVVFGENNEKI